MPRDTVVHKIRALILSLAAISLHACGPAPKTVYEPQDAAPSRVLDPAQIKDAIPTQAATSRYGNPASYTVYGKRYATLNSSKGFEEKGVASWYGTKFHGRRTSSGEPYDMYAMTAAHKSLPLPTWVEVTNLDNGRTAVVKVNDRGPFAHGRIIDLSYAAATKLGVLAKGTAAVKIRAIDPSRPESVASGLYLQVGVFSQPANARRLQTELKRDDLPDFHIVKKSASNKTLYRLQVGPFKLRYQADKFKSELAQKGLDAIVIYR